MREPERCFSRLAEHAVDLLYRLQLSPDRHLEYVNPASARITGYTPEELYADPDLWGTLLAGSGGLQPEAAGNGGAGTEQPLLVCLRRKDGSECWTEQQVVSVADETGKLIAIEGLVRDVTDRRLLEQALARQSRAVERLESVRRLASRVAHDFNNLLTVINGYSSMLCARVPESDPAHRQLLEIHRAGERGAALTRQLLVSSRPPDALRPRP